MSSRESASLGSAARLPLLAGRERERSALWETLQRACQGDGGLVLVSGEAGIGKTTLVEDLARRAATEGVLVLSGDCYDLAAAPPYGPWFDALSGYTPVQGRPSLPPTLRNGIDSGAVETQAELFRHYRLFLDDLSEQVPLLLVLEDLHWADRSSLDLLRDLTRRIGQSRILVVATWRVDELDRRHPLYRLIPSLVREAGGVRIDLHRLDEAAQRALIAARYPLCDDDHERLVSYLRQHAEGNPFFLTELLRTLEEERLLIRDSQDAWQVGDLSRAPVPELVRQVIDARVNRLGEDARHALQVAAVIGSEIPLDLWTELLDIERPAFTTVVERVVGAHLLREISPRGYRFSHALVREAIYVGMVLPSRQAWHRRVGDLLERRAAIDPTAVAYHFQQASDHRAASWLVRAGEHARRQFAPHAAIEHLSRALATPDELSADERTRAHLERGNAYETLGELDLAAADAQRARNLAREEGDWRLEWQSLIDLGEAWSPRHYELAGAYYQEAIDLARANGNQVTLGVSLNRLGNWRFNNLRLRGALELHNEALGIFEALVDLPNLARTHDHLAIC